MPPDHTDIDEPDQIDGDGHAGILCGQVEMGAYEPGIGDPERDGDVDLTRLHKLGSLHDGAREPAPCPRVRGKAGRPINYPVKARCSAPKSVRSTSPSLSWSPGAHSGGTGSATGSVTQSRYSA